MTKIEFQSDKVLTRTLFNNFGTLLVFTFYSQGSQKSLQFKENFESTIAIFGDHQNVKYFFIGLQSCPETFKKYEVIDTPTIIFTQTDKKVLRRFTTEDIGIVFDALGEEIVNFRQTFEKEKAIWHPKIKSILNQSQVVVFIKGTAQAPKCGFTETILKLLESHDISFTFYDILTDQNMRYWLRNYCGWPTYPQVHANGKLIGGLDVCKELIAKGELLAKIPRNSRVKQTDIRLKELLGEYKYLALTSQFSYSDQTTENFLSKIKSQYPDIQLKVYNTSLDEKLKNALSTTFNRQPPVFFISGQIQQI